MAFPLSRTFAARGPLGALALLLLLSAPPAHAKTHEVKAGESLWALAKHYGVSVEAIKGANQLGSGDTIRTGQKLTIPGAPADPKKASPEPAKAPAKKPEPAATKKPEPAAKAQPVAKKAEPAAKKAEKVTEPEPTAKEPELAAKKPEPAAKKAEVATAPSKPARPAPPSRAARLAAEELYSEASPPDAPDTLAERAPGWVLARPGADTQVEKSNAARGGVFPCAAPDPGFGKYSKWHQVGPMAHVLVPQELALDSQGRFDVLFHFHGRDPVRKEWVKAIDNTVLIAIDVGIDSNSYAQAFSDPRTFGQVLRATEAEVASRTGRNVTSVRRVGVSAWSAGYGALEQVLDQPYAQEMIDSVVLLDGLHSGYTDHSLDAKKLEPFVRFAQRASRGEVFMFVSHSSILPTGYASTTETAQYLVWKLGGKPQTSSSLEQDPMGLERISSFSRGNFHVRGFRGNGAADHCAHLGLMRDVLRVHLAPRWQRTPDSPEAPPQDQAVARMSAND